MSGEPPLIVSAADLRRMQLVLLAAGIVVGLAIALELQRRAEAQRRRRTLWQRLTNG